MKNHTKIQFSTRYFYTKKNQDFLL